jgi:hypothetical protein
MAMRCAAAWTRRHVVLGLIFLKGKRLGVAYASTPTG